MLWQGRPIRSQGVLRGAGKRDAGLPDQQRRYEKNTIETTTRGGSSAPDVQGRATRAFEAKAKELGARTPGSLRRMQISHKPCLFPLLMLQKE